VRRRGDRPGDESPPQNEIQTGAGAGSREDDGRHSGNQQSLGQPRRPRGTGEHRSTNHQRVRARQTRGEASRCRRDAQTPSGFVLGAPPTSVSLEPVSDQKR